MDLRLEPIKATVLSGHEASYLLSEHAVDVSLDLGLSTQPLQKTREGVFAAGKLIRWDVLEKMSSRPEDVFLLDDDFSKLAWFDQSFYRLVAPFWRKAPTIEINGIRMHRTVGMTPDEDAKAKVSLFTDLREAKVLDICTGLGYTAAAIAERGAKKVVTVEKDINVLRMATYNPWSRPLFSGKIDVVVADAVTFLESFQEIFDAVMHDPPTAKVASELYSTKFYRLIWKVMKRNGILVHYVGQPDVKKGVLFYKNVMRRLRSAGFNPIYFPNVLCVKAIKV